MKKVVFSMVLFASVLAVSAQPRAIGVRIGYGAEVSYQHSFGTGNMLQLDAGFPYFSSFQVVGTYNWLIPISSWKHDGSWNLYAGGGAGVGLGWWYYSSRYWGDYYGRYNSRVYGIFGLAGMFGAEYNFLKIPLQVFADYRPLIGIEVSGKTRFHLNGLFHFAVGARYRLDFNK